MSSYRKLLDYISYFENDQFKFYNWDSGYPSYDEKLKQFIQDVYETDLLKSDYLDVLGDIQSNLEKAIPIADMELLRSILTYYVRQERFCDGTWAEAVNEKVFLQILYRLKELEG